MKTLFLLLVGIFLLSVSTVKAVWTPYYTGVPYSLFAVDFWVNENNILFSDTGVAVGQGGTVLRTTDAGVSWTLAFQNLDIWLNDVKWATPTIVYAAGMGGVIIKSIDAGVTWTVIRPYDTPLHTFRGIAVSQGFDANAVTFVGYAGTYFETTNGGTTFTQRFDIPWTMHSIDFAQGYVTNGRGIICGTDGLVWNTTNWGANWVSRSTGRFDYLNDVAFFSGFEAWICGNNGTMLQSLNWGNTWTVYPAFTSQHLRSLDYNFGQSLPIYNVTTVGDNGTIYTSTNAGVTWTNQTPFGETRHFYGVCLNAPTKGTGVGEVGTGIGNTGMMFNTFDNGMVGVSQIGTTVPQKYSLNQNFPNPFNPTTKISFSMAKAGPVRLSVFDMTGKEVTTLVNTTLSAGNFEYTFDGSKLSSGIYFYRIITNDFVDAKKMSLMK